jgi:multicomponent Na+:H+ antiporter subunit D
MASVLGLGATVFYVVHHITVQTGLFLVTGLIEQRAGSANIDRLGGMAKISPLIAILFFIPAMNLGGIPPFSGFLAKVGLIQAGVGADHGMAWALVAASVVTSLLTLLVMVRVWTRSFWRRVEDVEHPPAKLVLALEETEARRAGRSARAVAVETQTTTPTHAGTKVLTQTKTPTKIAKGPARGMVYPTIALVAFGLAFTVFAGPLYAFSDRAATDMLLRTPYIEAVLGPEAAAQAERDLGGLEERGIHVPDQDNGGPGVLDSIPGDSEGHDVGDSTEGGQP